MATQFIMTHPKTGEVRTVFYGYSWTTLFFGPFPSLFRRDLMTFFCMFIVTSSIVVVPTAISVDGWGWSGIFISLVWSFLYNKYDVINLLKQGFVFSGRNAVNQTAAEQLGVVLNEYNTLPDSIQSEGSSD